MTDSGAGAGAGLFPALERRVGALVGALARGLALAGGLVLVALTAMTVASITGRGFNFLGLGPVPGDFELVEAGCAFAVFAFLPWCQYRRGHVTVDILIGQLGPRATAVTGLIGNLLITLAVTVIAWRLLFGLLEKRAWGETTFILQMPLWWAYAASLVGASVLVLVSLYTVWRSLNEVLGGQVQQ